MRIVIELEGGDGDVHVEPTARGAPAASSHPAAADDGGAGPSADRPGAEAADAVVATDAGPPPDWLLDAVGAAESAGTRDGPGPDEPGDGPAADAGAGPGASPTTPDAPGAPT